MVPVVSEQGRKRAAHQAGPRPGRDPGPLDHDGVPGVFQKNHSGSVLPVPAGGAPGGGHEAQRETA